MGKIMVLSTADARSSGYPCFKQDIHTKVSTIKGKIDKLDLKKLNILLIRKHS